MVDYPKSKLEDSAKNNHRLVSIQRGVCMIWTLYVSLTIRLYQVLPDALHSDHFHQWLHSISINVIADMFRTSGLLGS